MRSLFLISAILLHISWCCAFPAFSDGSWMPSFFNPFVIPNFIDRYKIEDNVKMPDNVNGLSDSESKPGAPGKPGGYYTISHSSYVTNLGSDGKMHTHGESVMNQNGKITKFKL